TALQWQEPSIFMITPRVSSDIDREERDSSTGRLWMTPAVLLGLQSKLRQLRRRLIARNDLAVGKDDRRRALHTDHLAQLILLGDRAVTGSSRHFLASFGLVHGRLLVLGAPDAGQRSATVTRKPLTRERHIAHFDAQAIELRHFA